VSSVASFNPWSQTRLESLVCDYGVNEDTAAEAGKPSLRLRVQRRRGCRTNTGCSGSPERRCSV